MPGELQLRSPNADAAIGSGNETTLRDAQLSGETPGPAGARQEARVGPDTQRRAKDGAREPAPAEANPLGEATERDRRTSEP